MNIKEQLNEIKKQAKNCFNCPLSENRTNTVFSDGCEQAPVMFIGEAPGKNEDETGIPFVGRAGQLLRNYLKEIGFKENDIYIANTVKCRPPENRKPSKKEKEACEFFLKKQIEFVNPKLIVLVGSTALESFIDKKTTITKARGQVFKKEYEGKIRKFIPIFHPSYLLRQHSERDGSPRFLFKKDLINIKENFI